MQSTGKTDEPRRDAIHLKRKKKWGRLSQCTPLTVLFGEGAHQGLATGCAFGRAAREQQIPFSVLAISSSIRWAVIREYTVPYTRAQCARQGRTRTDTKSASKFERGEFFLRRTAFYFARVCGACSEVKRRTLPARQWSYWDTFKKDSPTPSPLHRKDSL